MVCGVEIKETTTLPPQSHIVIPVNIPYACKLSKTPIVELSIELMEMKGVFLTPGIIYSNSNDHMVNVRYKTIPKH